MVSRVAPLSRLLPRSAGLVHRTSNEYCGTRGSVVGRTQALESSNGRVRIGQSCPNRNAVDIPTSSLTQTTCTFTFTASGLSQARDWNFHRVSILTVQPPVVASGRGPHPFFTSAALNLCCCQHRASRVSSIRILSQFCVSTIPTKMTKMSKTPQNRI